MSKGSASSLTEAELLLKRSSTWRRVGSDRARKMLSIGFADSDRVISPLPAFLMGQAKTMKT